jgi:periplasmic protein TonB
MPGLRWWGVESERDMYYATKRNNTQTRIIGVAGVAVALGVSGYALANGLGIIDVNQRVETEVVMIEELEEVVEEEPPPPPVDVDLPPLPDFVFDTPPPPENRIQQVQAVPNPQPPPPAARPAPPPRPAVSPKPNKGKFEELLNKEYPQSAIRKKQEGEVKLSMCMGVDGRASDVKIIRSSGVDSLDEAAGKGIPKLRFEPAKDGNGKPVAWCPPAYPAYEMTLVWKLPE